MQPGQFIEKRQLSGVNYLSIHNELYHPVNAASEIGIYFMPFFSSSQIIGITLGRRRDRLHGVEVRDGRYNGWIERDDAAKIGPFG